jgi:hypothetical protein
VARVNLPLNSPVDTDGWEGKIQNISQPFLWRNDSLRFGGALTTLKSKTFAEGIVTKEGNVLTIDANTILKDGKLLASFGGAEFVGKPISFDADALLMISNTLYAVKITGAAATLTTYTVSANGTYTPTGTTQRPVVIVNGLKRVQLVNNNGSIAIIQVSTDYFAINNISYSFPIALNSKFFPVAGYYDIVEPGLRARVFNPATSAWANIANIYDADLVGNTVYYTTMNDTDVAYYSRALAAENLTIHRWHHPTADNISIYSQTYHPLVPFTIFTDGTRYWWGDPGFYSFLETTQDVSGAYMPTTDWDRTTDGTSSLITTQFNRTWNRIGLFNEVRQAGNLLALSYNNILITPVGYALDNYSVSQYNSATYVIIKNTLTVISNQIPLRLTYIGKDLYKVNAAQIYNMLDVKNDDLLISSLDWNNRVKPEQVMRFSSAAVEYKERILCAYNSAFGGNYEVTNDQSTTILVASYHLSVRSDGSNQMFTYSGAEWQETNPEIYSVIDYYFIKSDTQTAPVYQTTGFRYVKPELLDLPYPEQLLSTILVPAPINADYVPNVLGISYVHWVDYYNIGISYNFKYIDSYTLTSSLDTTGYLFAISGSVFLYDDTTIYSIAFTNGQISGKDYLVDTGGMKYIGHNTVEAFFFSSDNILWSFTGSYALQVKLNLTRMGPLGLAIYCQETDDLILQFGGNSIRIRKGQIYTIPVLFTDLSLSRLGVVFYTDTGPMLLEPNISDGTSLPINLDTGYMGGMEDDMLSFKRIWIRIKEEAEFSMQARVLNDFEEKSTVQSFKGKEAVLVPKQINGRAIRVNINGNIDIAALSVEYDMVGKVPTLTGRGK